jgi:hypothetical protein
MPILVQLKVWAVRWLASNAVSLKPLVKSLV